MMLEQPIRIECFDACVYTLYPKFFENAPIRNLQKIFKFLFQFGYKDGNDKAIAALDSLLPELCENAKHKWAEASKAFQNGYQSTDRAALPSNLHYKKDIQAEIKRRKNGNDKLFRVVKSTKAQYQKQVKVWESYTEIKTKNQ